MEEHGDEGGDDDCAGQPAEKIGAGAFGARGGLAIGEDAAQEKASGEATEVSPIVDSREEKTKRENGNHPGNQARAHGLDIGTAAPDSDGEEQSNNAHNGAAGAD